MQSAFCPDQEKVNDPYGVLGGLEDLSMVKMPNWPGNAMDPTCQLLLAPPGVFPTDSCGECGGILRRGADNISYVCDECGLLIEGDSADQEDDEGTRQASNAARLRLVGPNSNQLQPDLYRSGTGNTAATQKKLLFDEYKVYRQMHIEAGGRAFPLDACELASDYYNEVQRVCVKRSQNKKAIMASCFNQACLVKGYAPLKSEVAMFLQLPSKGIARGENFIRKLVADGDMDINVNVDQCRPEITSLFALLGLEGKEYSTLRDAVYEVVQIAIDGLIGTNSYLRSKVAGATYVVLCRCKDRDLIPKAPTLVDFCEGRIRKNTVERFTRDLIGYHSYFEECYEKFGLDTTPPR